MSIRLQTICVDATDPLALGRWWAELLGWRFVSADEDGELDEDECSVVPPAGSTEDGVAADLLFTPVPGAKAVKNRLHLDLRPDDHAAEVARAEALGARRVDIGQGDDKTWVVLADPEGNEFCILRALTAPDLAEAPPARSGRGAVDPVPYWR